MGKIYRVRKSWKEKDSQKGAYRDLDTAINIAKFYSYNVYDEEGTCVFQYDTSTHPYKVSIYKSNKVNLRSTPEISDNVVGMATKGSIFTIKETKNGFGKIDDNLWISLSCTCEILN